MSSSSPFNGAPAAALEVLRYMRRDAGKSDVGDEILGFVAPVGAKGLLLRTREWPARDAQLAPAPFSHPRASPHWTPPGSGGSPLGIDPDS